MKNLKLIIFDLDGTLVDSEKTYRKGWSDVLKTYGYDIDESEFEVMRGNSTAHNNEIIKSYLGSEELVNEARDQREEYYFTALENGDVELKPGALEILKTCKQADLTLGVATSSYKARGIATLKKLGLLDYFDYLAFGDEVTHSKPHQEIYQSLLDEAGVNSKEAIAIEDSASGMKSALAAGLRTYLVPESEVDMKDVTGEYTVHEDLFEVAETVFGNEV